jgi:hypothetical protein
MLPSYKYKLELIAIIYMSEDPLKIQYYIKFTKFYKGTIS